jgi:hypothetical protein
VLDQFADYDSALVFGTICCITGDKAFVATTQAQDPRRRCINKIFDVRHSVEGFDGRVARLSERIFGLMQLVLSKQTQSFIDKRHHSSQRCTSEQRNDSLDRLGFAQEYAETRQDKHAILRNAGSSHLYQPYRHTA